MARSGGLAKEVSVSKTRQVTFIIPERLSESTLFVTLAIFRSVTAGKESEFLAAQQAFGEWGKGLRGFRERHMFRDESSGALVALSIWESKETFEAAGPDLMKYRAEKSRAGKDFSRFLDVPEELYRLTPIRSVPSEESVDM